MGRQCDMIDELLLAKAHSMLILTYLLAFITTVFRGMPGVWKSQHRLKDADWIELGFGEEGMGSRPLCDATNPAMPGPFPADSSRDENVPHPAPARGGATLPQRGATARDIPP